MSKFKVGDNVVRTTDVNVKAAYLCVTGAPVVVVACDTNYVTFSPADGGEGWFSSNFELYEEEAKATPSSSESGAKQMFDMKKEPWGIFWKTHEERDAIVDWLKSQGFETKNIACLKCLVGSFSNLGYGDKSYGFGSGTKQDFYWWDGEAKEIKLTFKTETTITNVEFPEILTEKEIETKKIREEMESLAERLKKLEGN